MVRVVVQKFSGAELCVAEMKATDRTEKLKQMIRRQTDMPLGVQVLMHEHTMLGDSDCVCNLFCDEPSSLRLTLVVNFHQGFQKNRYWKPLLENSSSLCTVFVCKLCQTTFVAFLTMLLTF